ncbi:MAG: SIR2 family NAD-dependent protein deacylase [Chloroflexota bacterium]
MDEFDKAAELIAASKRMVVFTGAGLSTESGVPDFRSPGGIWERFDPNEFLYVKFMASQEVKEKYWAFCKERWPVMSSAEPNAAHLAIAELERLGKVDCVVTQNIDTLHQKSGIPEEKIIELHGTTKWVECLGCGKRYPREDIQEWLEQGVTVPTCPDCGEVMKPATVMFGQSMPERETREAEKRSAACDLFLSLGSSLVVYPAAQMPLIAKNNGANLIIINLTPAPHDVHADVAIHRKLGEAMQEILDRVKSLFS